MKTSTRRFALTYMYVVLLGSASQVLAAGAPSIRWAVHDRTTNQTTEIRTPSSRLVVDGNHAFDVSVIVRDAGRAGVVSIGGKIKGLRCGHATLPANTPAGASSTPVAIKKALPQREVPALSGQETVVTLSLNGDENALCPGTAGTASRFDVLGGTIYINGSSLDKRSPKYQAVGRLTIELTSPAR